MYISRASRVLKAAPIQHARGVTLIELIVFIVVISVSLGVFVNVVSSAIIQTVDPVVRVKALEKAKAQLDEVLSRRFDENTPVGGIPACNSASGVVCAGIAADADYDDVGDYNGFTDNSDPLYPISVSVVNDGTNLGLTNINARLITVTVSMPGGDSLVVSSYKVNF